MIFVKVYTFFREAKMLKRLTVIAVIFAVMFSVLYMRIYVLVTNEKYSQAAAAQSACSLTVGNINANIYDRNFEKLTNTEYKYIAAVNPTVEAAEEILPHVIDKDEYYSQLVCGAPFTCEVDTNEFKSRDITVFAVPVRYGEKHTAVHITGYLCDGVGVTGIESAYEDFLRSHTETNKVTYGIDGQGTVLEGIDKKISPAGDMKAGVVLTIDKYIQAIAELAGQKMEKGAVVIMDIRTGDILGMASFPYFNPNDIGSALEDKNSPLINRCLYSYSVGSIFKLVTALSAFEDGIDESFCYDCTGSTRVSGQLFKCHELSGHGVQDMTQAMSNSCNTYFIKLAEKTKTETLHKMAERLGFGVPMSLCLGMNVSGGTLQTMEELSLPAEKANFSFGQGKLTASPLQICRFTAAIANEGKLFQPRLVRGTTENGTDIKGDEPAAYTQVFDRDTAFRLQDLMIASVDGSPNSKARPKNTRAAGKTSTAQTGVFDKDGEELCHGWITGFFPLSQPRYAVTVLCEDGGYGNQCAAPVFREIAERITDIYG